MKELKMSDLFPEQVGYPSRWSDDQVRYANKAIKSHDQLTKDKAELLEALNSMVKAIDTIWIEEAYPVDPNKALVNYTMAKQLISKHSEGE